MRIEKKFREIWRFDKVISRIAASWIWFLVFTLTKWGDYRELAFGQGYSLAAAGLWILGNFILFSLIGIACQPYHSDSWLLMSGVAVCAWIWLIQPPTESNGTLTWLAVTLLCALVFVWGAYANRRLFCKWKMSGRTAVIIGVAAAVVSCAVIAVITCLRYKTFSSPNYDFGLFVNMFHNMSESGLPMVTSERDQLLSHFAVHISPVYYLLLPFYYVIPSPLTLQIGQAVVLMLGIIPVLLLAKHFKLSPRSTAAVALLYAFYPALTTGCFYDLHENCFLPLFLLLTFYFFESKKPIPMYLSVICVLAVKEDAAIYILIFAIYLVLSRKSYLHGVFLGVLAGGWFFAACQLLEIYGTGIMSYRFDNLIYNGEGGLLGAVKTAFLNPGYLLTQLFTTSSGTWDKFAYVLKMLLPVACLPLCTKKASRWLLAAPMLLNLLTNYTYQYDIGFQYQFGIAAFLIYAMIQNLPELSEGWRRSMLAVALASCFTLYVFAVLPTYNYYTERYQTGKDTYARMEQILEEQVPWISSVNCDTFLLAHLADRSEIYEIGYHGNKPDVDYVVLDARYNDWQQKAGAYTMQGYEMVFCEEGTIVILKSGVAKDYTNYIK